MARARCQGAASSCGATCAQEKTCLWLVVWRRRRFLGALRAGGGFDLQGRRSTNVNAVLDGGGQFGVGQPRDLIPSCEVFSAFVGTPVPSVVFKRSAPRAPRPHADGARAPSKEPRNPHVTCCSRALVIIFQRLDHLLPPPETGVCLAVPFALVNVFLSLSRPRHAVAEREDFRFPGLEVGGVWRPHRLRRSIAVRLTLSGLA